MTIEGQFTRERLYRVAWVHREEEAHEDDESIGGMQVDPDGWAEFCEAKWGAYRPFFFPSTARIYRSRSAAQERAASINHWGGAAVVLVCTPTWQTIEHSKRERELARSHRRIESLNGELARALKRRADVTDQLRALDG